MGQSSTGVTPNRNGNYGQAMAIIATLFFIFGFVTWLNAVLIPFLKQACELTDAASFLVATAFYISYFVMAIPSSRILKKTGFPNGMSIGLITIAIGSLIFIPAAMMRYYPIFLVGLFVQGTGLTLLQTASNPYITIIGPLESAGKRISIMGICNKVAGMIGILVLAKVLFSDTEELSKHIDTLSGAAREAELDLLASRLIMPYLIMAGVLLLLAIFVRKSNLPEINQATEDGEAQGDADPYGRTSITQAPYIILGAIAIFFYVGVEVLAIDALAMYGEYHRIPADVASMLGIYSLIAFAVGYIIGVFTIPKIMSQHTAFITCIFLGMAFTAGALLTTGITSVIFLVLCSFAHSLMWPGIWPLAMNKAGSLTKLGGALLIMGIAGGALIPPVYGYFADLTGDRQWAFLIMIPCYLYLLYYALSGHKVGLPKK